MKSILQTDGTFCFYCQGYATETHHVIGGAHSNRVFCEEDGLTIRVCRRCHDKIHSSAHGVKRQPPALGASPVMHPWFGLPFSPVSPLSLHPALGIAFLISSQFGSLGLRLCSEGESRLSFQGPMAEDNPPFDPCNDPVGMGSVIIRILQMN